MTLEEVQNSSLEDRKEILEMFTESTAYMLSHFWCSAVENVRYGGGFAQVGVFFLLAITEIGPVEYWVIVGDLPPLYLDTNDDQIDTAAEALDMYTYAMDIWVEKWSGVDSKWKVPPVVSRREFKPVQPTKQNVEKLRSRLEFLRREVVPFLQQDLD